MNIEYTPEEIIDHDEESQQVLIKWLNYNK